MRAANLGLLQACLRDDDAGAAAIIRVVIEKLNLGLARCIRVVTAGLGRVAGSW